MKMKLANRQRFLVVYSGLLTVVFVTTIFLGAKQPASRKETFNEIDVQRINIVEPDGTVRMIISDTARAPGYIFRGKEYPHPDGRKLAGMVFYNDEGTENGGLIWDGNKDKDGKVSSHGHLSFDNYEQDQVMVIEGNQDEEGKSSFIRIMDQPDYSVEPLMQLIEKNRDLPKEQQHAALRNFLKSRPQPQARLFLGRRADRSVALILKDPEGPRPSCAQSRHRWYTEPGVS
ncbi:MAG: hypothetical protein DME65_03655 [Verrucomicrobia bacterium]|nr:MAG: hypothetical protein DME65_03655 [Verrucomicrobiota bacterium]